VTVTCRALSKKYKSRLLIQNGYIRLTYFLLITSRPTVADITSQSTYSWIFVQRRHSLLFRSSISNKRLRGRTFACLRFNNISSLHNLRRCKLAIFLEKKLTNDELLSQYQTRKRIYRANISLT